MSKGRALKENFEFSGMWPGVCSENNLYRVPAAGYSGGWKGLNND